MVYNILSDNRSSSYGVDTSFRRESFFSIFLHGDAVTSGEDVLVRS
jgi:hypothetical protein